MTLKLGIRRRPVGSRMLIEYAGLTDAVGHKCSENLSFT